MKRCLICIQPSLYGFLYYIKSKNANPIQDVRTLIRLIHRNGYKKGLQPATSRRVSCRQVHLTTLTVPQVAARMNYENGSLSLATYEAYKYVEISFNLKIIIQKLQLLKLLERSAK